VVALMDIVEFLTARLDEDEQAALGVSDGPRKPEEWVAKQWPYGTAPRNWAVDCPFGAVVVDGSFRASAEHIARHDPARVLREVAAKRRTLARHRPATGEEIGWYVYAGACFGCGTEGEFADPRTRKINDCPELRDVIATYAEHPNYNPSWSVA
jgi:hypothetical protein